LIDTYRLPPDALAELAVGHGGRSVMGYLRAAQHSKHLMLLHALAKEVAGLEASSPAADAFRSGYDLLIKVQAERPDEVERLVSLPQVGAWAHDCIVRLDQGLMPDYGYLAMLAAAAALRAGAGFELEVPITEGQIRLPGLGCLTVEPATDSPAGRPTTPTGDSSVRLSSNGEHLTVGQFVRLPCETLRPADLAKPDAGNAESAQWWSGTPLIRAIAAGYAWDALLEVDEGHFGRFPFPAAAVLTAEELKRWQDRVQAAWRLLARQSKWPLDAFADVVSVVVPLAQDAEADFVSVTSPAAFGAIATSWPPDPVAMAEMLVHEFQHLKLSALMDMVPLVVPGSGKSLGYAPWRPDPRPAGGLLQGIYAHLAVARFWDIQRGLEEDPDELFRAHVLYERWRRTIESTAHTLLAMGDCLTPEGVSFVETLKGQGRLLDTGSVPPSARQLAEETALDHWLTWQVRHIELDPAEIARTAAAYLSGEPPEREALPAGTVRAYIRQVAPAARSRMLCMRESEPKRFRQERAEGEHSLSRADGLLLDGNAGEASEAYRDEILAGVGPAPQSWLGLAIAASRLAPAPLRNAFATRLPLMFEVHCYLARQGVPSDPMDVAAWLA
jgi:HEXXH motif-containing protein